MKIIFLDIDGVLNSRPYLIASHDPFGRSDEECIDVKAVMRLNDIVRQTDAKVVISSTWRLNWSPEEIETMMKKRGFIGKVVGATTALPTTRGHEIQAWLSTAIGVKSFVVLDDDSDMDVLMHRLVQTSFDSGLLEKHVDEAVSMLNGEYLSQKHLSGKQ